MLVDPDRSRRGQLQATRRARREPAIGQKASAARMNQLSADAGYAVPVDSELAVSLQHRPELVHPTPVTLETPGPSARQIWQRP